jgi:hypothetical protein
VNFASVLLPVEGRIDRRGGLAVVLPEQVGVDAQGDAWLRVPQALADRYDVDASVDQLTSVRTLDPPRRSVLVFRKENSPPVS